MQQQNHVKIIQVSKTVDIGILNLVMLVVNGMRPSVWLESPTTSSLSRGGGPGADPRKQTHFWQQSIENWLKIRSLTSLVGKHESTYLNN